MRKSMKRSSFSALLKGNRGDFGIKQIAVTVGVVVLIGVVVNFMSDKWLTDRVNDVWTWLWNDVIKNFLK